TPYDPLCNGVVDLSSDKFQLSESDYVALVNENACIRMLSKDYEIKNICSDFVVRRNEVQKLKKFVLSSAEIATHNQRFMKGDVPKFFYGNYIPFDRCYHVPLSVECEVDVTRAKQQSIANKNRKNLYALKVASGMPVIKKIVQLGLDVYEEISKNCKKGINIASESLLIHKLTQERRLKNQKKNQVVTNT
ncbi:15317_t:CDS:2, partial [Gigaspora rosea]